MNARQASPDVGFRIWVSAGIVVMLAIGAAAIWWGGGDTGAAHQDSGSQAESSQDTESHPNPQGGELQVVDKGITATTDAFDEPMASYGIVLRNTSDQVAFRTTAEITMMDDGKEVKDLERNNTQVERNVFAVLPGENTVITSSTFVEGNSLTDVDVSLSGTEWLPLDNEDPSFAPLIARDVNVDVDNNLTRFTFAVRSEYESPLENPSAQALLRDAQGNIVGGTNATDSQTDVYKPGMSEGEIESRGGLPEKFDESSVEVYPSPAPA